MNDQPSLSAPAAAQYLGVSMPAMYEIVRKRRVSAYKTSNGRAGGEWRISFESLLDYDDRRDPVGLTTRQVGERLGIGDRGVSHYVLTGRLHPIYRAYTGGACRYDPDEVEVLRQEMDPPVGYITSKEAAARLRVTYTTISKYAMTGRIKSTVRGRNRYLCESDVSRFTPRKRRARR